MSQMEDKDAIIAELRNEIKAQDKNIYVAAKYGKLLVEDKIKLSAKIEDLLSQKELLEQEKHSLQLDLERKVQALNSQTNELECQRDQADNLQDKLQISMKENEALHKKIENIRKENQHLKKSQEDLGIENKLLKDKISLLDKQMKNFENQAEKSLCEADKDESQELLAQLNTYMLNNKELQDGLSQIQCELEMAKKNENHLLEMVQELEETLSDRNDEISTCKAEMKVTKEEIEELHVVIEGLKFDQVDVNRRGNSVFAELDDRRNMVEREYKILRKKFEDFKKNYDENKKELDKARGQMVILQSMASRDYQQTYINKLEDSLSSARIEISDLTHKLSKAVKSNAKVEDKKFSEKNEYDYLRVMLKQSQKKEKELQNEVLDLKTQNMFDNDKLTETQCLLYKAKEDHDSTKRENFNLKIKIKELERGIIRNLPVEPVTCKPKVEILEGFKPLTTNENIEKVKNLNCTLFPDPDIIPGELELGEDGFKQVKPSRKSNRFILREFNKVEPDEVSGNSLKTSNMKGEFVKDTETETIVAEEREPKPKQISSHSKIPSKRKNDNCAQQ